MLHRKTIAAPVSDKEDDESISGSMKFYEVVHTSASKRVLAMVAVVPVRRDGRSTGGPRFRTTTQASQTSQSSPTHLLHHHDHHQVYKVWARGVEGFLQRLERSSMMEAPEEWKCHFFHSANKRCRRSEDCTFAHDQDHPTGWEAARKRPEQKPGTSSARGRPKLRRSMRRKPGNLERQNNVNQMLVARAGCGRC